MAMFRPEPTAEMRTVFNILHFLVGTAAQLASGINCCSVYRHDHVCVGGNYLTTINSYLLALYEIT